MDLGFPLDIFFVSVFLPSTLDPALCFRFKNEFSTSALFCFLLFSRTLLVGRRAGELKRLGCWSCAYRCALLQ
jgi:hypothetical protein